MNKTSQLKDKLVTICCLQNNSNNTHTHFNYKEKHRLIDNVYNINIKHNKASMTILIPNNVELQKIVLL